MSDIGQPFVVASAQKTTFGAVHVQATSHRNPDCAHTRKGEGDET